MAYNDTTETITVDEAITRGEKMVKYPVIAIVVITILGGFAAGFKVLVPMWSFAAGFVLAFLLGWLYWSIKITQWKVWAFTNVRNVHELKKRALQEKLIWADNSFFQRTEIWTADGREKWDALQRKFLQEDVFADDITVPAETHVYFARKKNYIEMTLGLCCVLGGIYLAVIKKSYLIGAVLALPGGYLAYKKYKKAINTEPQIMLDAGGMQTISTPFYRWSEIYNEEVVSKQSGKYVHYYLQYNHPQGEESLCLDDLDTRMRKLNKLLILYRGRHNKSRQQKG